jgi:hypothetical protein
MSETESNSLTPDGASRMMFEYLANRYVQRADQRQFSMGLQYTEAETHDLADEVMKYLHARALAVAKMEEREGTDIEELAGMNRLMKGLFGKGMWDD